MNGIANIENTLAKFMLRLDNEGLHIYEITKEMRSKDEINDRLEFVQTNGTFFHNYRGSTEKKKRRYNKRWQC